MWLDESGARAREEPIEHVLRELAMVQVCAASVRYQPTSSACTKRPRFMPVTGIWSASSSTARRRWGLLHRAEHGAARPAALVAFTCAALVLYWAAVPIAR